MEASKEALHVVYDKTNGTDRTVVSVIHRDEKTGHQIFYRCEKMDIDEIAELINGGVVVPLLPRVNLEETGK